MSYEDELGDTLVGKKVGEGGIDIADVEGGISEGALGNAFEDFEGDAVGGVVETEDGAVEREG